MFLLCICVGLRAMRNSLSVLSHRHHEHSGLLFTLTGAQETIAALHFASQLARSCKIFLLPLLMPQIVVKALGSVIADWCAENA